MALEVIDNTTLVQHCFAHRAEYAYMTVRIIWIILCIIGNCTYIVLYLSHRVRTTITHTILFFMSLSDLLLGVCGPILSIIQTFAQDSKYWKSSCIVLLVTVTMGSGFMQAAMCGLAVDKYLYINKSLEYPFLLTSRRIAIILTSASTYIVIMVSVVFGLGMKIEEGMQCDIRVLLDKTAYFWGLSHTVLLTMITCALHMNLYYTQLQKANCSPVPSHMQNILEIKNAFRSQRNIVTKKILLVIGLHFALYLPLMTGYSDYMCCKENEAQWKDIIRQMSLLVFYAISWCNPIIYALTSDVIIPSLCRSQNT